MPNTRPFYVLITFLLFIFTSVYAAQKPNDHFSSHGFERHETAKFDDLFFAERNFSNPHPSLATLADSCTVDLGPDLGVCENNCITLSVDEAEGSTYLWSTGETTSSILYCPLTTANVWVEVTDSSGCIAADTVLISLLLAPVFNLGDDIPACPGDTVSISGPENPGFLYEWRVNDSILPETSSILQWVANDTVWIKLTVTNVDGCSSADSLVIILRDKPFVQVVPHEASLCVGQSIEIQGSAMFAENYEWFDGSTNSSYLFYAAEAGTTYCWLKATNGYGCSSADTCVISVHPVPVFNLTTEGNVQQVCAGTYVTIVVTFPPPHTVDTLIWNGTLIEPVAGQSAVSQSFLINQTQTITVEGIGSGGCTTFKSISVEAVAPPIITITGPSALCEGESAILTASGGQSCSWYIGNQLIGSSYSIEINPTTSNWYKALVTGAMPTQCQSKDSIFVVVNPRPLVVIQPASADICKGSEVTLAASGANSYVWNNGMTGAVISVTPETNQVFSVTGTNLAGCSSAATASITVRPIPIVSLSGLLPVYCPNDPPDSLIGLPAGGSFIGPLINGNIFDPQQAGAGYHSLYYQLTNTDGCTGKDSLMVRVIDFDQTINLGADQLICPHESVTFDAGSGFEYYFWSTGQNTSQISVSGATIPAGTTKIISVAAGTEGCVATGRVLVTVRDDCYTGINENAKTDQLADIYPNPAKGIINIRFNEAVNGLILQWYDTKGQMIWQEKNNQFYKAAETLQLNVSNKISGLYTLLMIHDNGRFTRQIVIE